MNEIIKETANRLGLSEAMVSKIVKNYFRSLKRSVTKIDFKKQQTIADIKTNCIIPGFGKLVVNTHRKNNFKANIYE